MIPNGGIFLLTKPPKSSRSEICLKLIARSEDAALYLIGDGVYHALSEAFLPSTRVYACKEDMDARGIPPGRNVIVLSDFYERLVDDVMEHANHVYTF